MLKMYVLLDNKVEAYNQPMFFNNDEEAKDALGRYINSEEGQNINPVDYELFYLGEFDPQTAKFELSEAPKHMNNLRLLISKPQEKENTDG